MTLGDVLAHATRYLEERGVESARLDAERLLARALGLSRLELYTHHDRPLTPDERTRVRELVRRRGGREPLAYVLGDWDFRRLTLKTDARALVPRPETEVVVGRCLALLQTTDTPVVVDVGTGAGAIALALKHERPDAHVTGTDASEQALELARENAQANGLDVRFVETDLLAGLDGRFDLVVANPPYVLAAELESLEPEVRDWEPRSALLDEGQTERLAAQAAGRCTWLVLEAHPQRVAAIVTELKRLGYGDVSIREDLAGRERIVEGRWSG